MNTPDLLDQQDATAAEGERLAGEFRADCAICGKPFTDQEWLDRHTPSKDPLADVHDYCCPDCKGAIIPTQEKNK